jgi:predicted dehydrogenase
VFVKKARVGVVGFGLMGQLYADALADNPQAELKAVADTRGERLDFAKKTYGCAVYENYQAMYDSGSLDCVLVTLPDFLHRDPVVTAAEAGLHILVEKPFATNMDDADAMVKAVEKSRVKCMVEFFNRWSPPFTYAKKAVDRGDVGEIVSFSVELNDSVSVPTEMLAWSARSSPVWFLMSHTADLASWITGKKPRREGVDRQALPPPARRAFRGTAAEHRAAPAGNHEKNKRRPRLRDTACGAEPRFRARHHEQGIRD